jgi:putative nucleotidyltransferase with HDIG domain
MPTINDYLNRARNLPPARVVPELLKLLKRPNLDSSRIVHLLAPDATLTAHVLRICNSAFYGGTTPTEDLSEAVTRVGFQGVYRIVAAASGARLLGSALPGYGMGPGELWRHSFVAATAAQIIARELGEDQNLAFTATLMHDAGKVLLSPALEAAGANLAQENPVPITLVEAERKFLGVEHAEMGGRLLERWNFPPEIVSAVWFHHTPKGARSDRKLAALVYLGNVTACLMGHAHGHLPLAMRGRSEVFFILGLAPDSLPRCLLAAFDQLQTPDALSAMAAA